MRSSLLFFPCVVIVFVAAACGDAGSRATDDANGGDAGQSADGATSTDGSVSALGDGGSSSDSGASPTIARSFDGDNGPGLTACQSPTASGHCDRPEPGVAANGSQVVQITWQNVSVYDYSGNLQTATPLPTLVTSAGLAATSGTVKAPYEPHIVFDEFIQRWIITASCAYDCLLVSASSDAKGSWAGIYIDNDGSDPSIRLGYDKNGVYLSEGQAGGSNATTGVSGYAQTYFAIPSAEMQWVGTFSPAHLNRAGNKPLDGIPIVDQNPSKKIGDPTFFITKTCNGNCQNATNYSFRWAINTLTWSGTTATYSGDQIIDTAVGSAQNQWIYNTPIAAVSQLGTTTQVRPIESHRVLNVVQDGTSIYATVGSGPCTSGCGSQGVDSKNLFFWAELDCTNPSACVVSQTGKASDPNNHLEFTTIGVASTGNIAIVAASVGASTNPSIDLWTHAKTDPANTLNGPTTVIAGTQPYTCMLNPVSFVHSLGINTVRDPLDPTKLWTTHQYSNSSAPCVWATRVMELAP